MPTPLTALVVDDSPELLLLLSSLFRRMGLNILTARSGEAGLAVARESRPDIVCLDLMLPTVSGLEVCRQIKADPELAQAPVLIVSARRLPQDRAAADQAGADAYLTKPVDRHDFDTCVRSLLWRTRATVVA